MLIPFRKMQAQGNDFALMVLTGVRECRLDLPKLAQAICDRRKGVGADGFVLLTHDDETDARMTIFNSDGSRAAMCGSALRCCSALLFEQTGDRELRISTDSGIKAASVEKRGGNLFAKVNLGKPRFLERQMKAEKLTGSLVDVGNRHFVSFWEELSGQEFTHGPALENSACFPGGVNSEFVRVVSRSEIEMKVWERGCGATQACGTGAVASVFSGIARNLLDKEVTVNMPGGSVRIRENEDGDYILAGQVEHSFSGVFRWKI